MRYLVFQCYAPLVSWGEIAIGLERHSSRQPSKSAIIGLLAAALGIKRDDNQRMEALIKAIGFAVKMVSGGIVLKDFHTAQVPRSERKTVYHTRRDELNAPQEKPILFFPEGSIGVMHSRLLLYGSRIIHFQLKRFLMLSRSRFSLCI